MAEARLDLTDELLVAYVDDELDAPQRAMVRAVLDSNPALSRRADEMRLSRDLLCEAFPLQPDAEVPAAIGTASARLAAACTREPSGSAAQCGSWRRRNLTLAAGFLLCVLAGATYFILRPAAHQARPLVTALTQISPENPLHAVLESTASAELIKIPAEDAAVRAVLTFQAKDGRFCREFEMLDDSGSSTGIACRENGRWRTEVLASGGSAPTSGNSYTPAGASDEAAVAKVYEDLVEGEPLGAEEETRLLASWRLRDSRDP